jgi:hypothetical protein
VIGKGIIAGTCRLAGVVDGTGDNAWGDSGGTTGGKSGTTGVGLAVASGVGVIDGALAEGELDRMLGMGKPPSRRESDQNRMAPIALKATKMATNSSNPKGVLGDDCGSGEFVIYSTHKAASLSLRKLTHK